MRISKRERKALLILVAALALCGLAWLGFYLWDYVRDLDKQKENDEKTLKKMVSTIAEKKSYEQGLVKMRNVEKSIQSVFVTGTDPGAVVSELMKIIRQLANDNGVDISRTDTSIKPERFSKDAIKADPRLADYVKVKIWVTMRCTPDKMAQLISAIENHQKLLIIEKLQIQSWNLAGGDKMISPSLMLITYLYQPEKKEPPKKKENRT